MNIPNMLSIIRLLLVPVFCVAFFTADDSHIAAGLIFLAASATDMLDGYIARRFNQVTKLGRILDPLADKLMTATALISMFIVGMIPLWIGLVVICKELLMASGGIFLYNRLGDMPPSNIAGKTATAMFFVSIVIMMLFDIPKTASTVMLGIATGFTVLALVTYFYQFRKLFVARSSKPKRQK